MTEDWVKILKAIAPQAKLSIIKGLAPHLDEFFEEFAINTLLRQAHFLAQAAHESAHFTTLKEIGGPSYFRRYDGRRDLGNVKPGDGNRYHGRGIFQLTGRANYRTIGKKLGLPLEDQPELAARPDVSLRVAGTYWNSRRLSPIADRDDVVTITKKINGGKNGLADRMAKLERAKRALGLSTRRGILEGEEDTTWNERHGIAPEVDTEIDEDAAAEIEAIEAKEPADDLAFKIQCQLRQLGYYEAGDPDNSIGKFTKIAIYAFKLDNNIEPLDHEITPEFLQALSVADPRQVGEKRAQATTKEVADKVPEVKASLKAKIASGWQAGIAGGSAVLYGAKETLDNTLDAVSPFRSSIASLWNAIPPFFIFLALAAIAGVSFWIFIKSRKAVAEGKEAYQLGARR